MGLRMKNYIIFGVHWKIWLLEGGSRKTDIEGGLPKRGTWTVCRFKGGGGAWQERGRGGVFEGGLIPQCTLCVSLKFISCQEICK